jgi:predicted RNase H-like HicB family nuclease
MSEIIFEVCEAEEGGFWARALDHSIFTQGEDWNDLRAMVKDAVVCHFEKEAERPKIIRLHYVRDEVLAS